MMMNEKYWTAVRVNVAIDFLPRCMLRKTPQEAAKRAVEYADALVEELKGCGTRQDGTENPKD